LEPDFTLANVVESSEGMAMLVALEHNSSSWIEDRGCGLLSDHTTVERAIIADLSGPVTGNPSSRDEVSMKASNSPMRQAGTGRSPPVVAPSGAALGPVTAGARSLGTLRPLLDRPRRPFLP
jgi:hypothetical protein